MTIIKVPKVFVTASMRARRDLILVFAFAIVHRITQWLLLWPQFEQHALRNGEFQVMQLLPAQWWRTDFWGALWYLQQTPPIPNLLFGLTAVFTDSFVTQSAILVLFTCLLDCLAAVLLCLLLFRLQLPRWVAVGAALVFVVGADLVLNDYTAFGFLFYEQLAMVECLVAVLAAIAFVRRPSALPLLTLGVCVALLALTRASFAFFFLPVLAWVGWITLTRQRPLLLVCFLLPVLLLHGGWAVKQRLAQGQWMWSTSSWGGANMQVGEMKRVFWRSVAAKANNTAPEAVMPEMQQAPCLARWQPIVPVFAFASAPASTSVTAEGFGPSPAARSVDAATARLFPSTVPTNTAAFRELSACLQRAMLDYWLASPVRAIRGWWMSYGIFWSSMAEFADVYPSVLVTSHNRWLEPLKQPVWQPQGVIELSPGYRMREDSLLYFVVTYNMRAEPAQVLALPVVPGLLALLALCGVHLLPLVAIAAWTRRSGWHWPAGFSFVVLTYLYLAAVANLVEYGENMRFRLAVEPLCWAIALVTIALLAQMLRSGWRNRGIQPTATGL